MAVLVTGATGLVGRHLVATLDEPVIAAARSAAASTDGADDVSWATFDLREEPTIRALPWSDVDAVVHLAAYTETRGSVDEPHRCFATNASGTSALLTAAHDADVSRFVYASSYWVYDPSVTGHIDESTPVRVETPYGASKAAADLQCDAFRVRSDMLVTSLRPFNVYGPGARPHQVVPEFVEQAVEAGVIEPHPGNPVRDFLYVDDLVSAITGCLTARTDDVFNVGSGEGTSIRELAGIVAEVVETHTGERVETLFSGDQEPADPKVADTTKLRGTIDWAAETSLRAGIERLTSHYLDTDDVNDA